MIRVEVHFNGGCEVRLVPESDEDHQLLGLAFKHGNEVLQVRKPVKESVGKEAYVLVLGKPQSPQNPLANDKDAGF